MLYIFIFHHYIYLLNNLFLKRNIINITKNMYLNLTILSFKKQLNSYIFYVINYILKMS